MESVGTALSIHQVSVATFLIVKSCFICSGQREIGLLRSLEMLDNKHPVTQHYYPEEQISTAVGPQNPHFNIMPTLRMSGDVPLRCCVSS